MPSSKSFNPGQNPVRRVVTLAHSDSNVQFNALPIPRDVPTTAPPGKGIRTILNWILEPEIKVNGVVATTFGSAVTVMAEFTAQDAADAPRGPDGKPRITLFSAWKDGNRWKWEKLATTVDWADDAHTHGTLTAPLRNLHPNDPIGDGFD